ncbi:RNA polymerase sigma factor [Pseudonocardia sp. TRM90224]|uniref:RNA polymerase sigma factor n=1 Tax=Pseudonocardia sp. TRM90224 TaxID=2812678 RepID=UPI001E365D7A|nr:sigma-70 family RNA polymerase sigma factor [Pseudonocardia sp. TRM90224]
MPEQDPAQRFTALYDQHYPRVFAYLAGRAGQHIAEEAASETFMVAWRRLDDIPATAVVPWLLTVARNVLHDSYRKELRRAALASDLERWADATDQAGSDIAEHVADRAEVLRALARMSDADRELLTLVAWHGLGPADAARVLGCSAATFAVRLHRARRRFDRAVVHEAECTEPATTRTGR